MPAGAVRTRTAGRAERAARDLVVARTLLWTALTVPFFYTTSRTADAVRAAGLGPLEIVRGGGALVLIVVSYALVRPSAKRVWTLGPVLFLGFCVVALASSLWSIDPRATALKAIPLVSVYLAAYRLAQLYDDFEHLMHGLARLLHVYIALAAAQFVLIPGRVYTSDLTSTSPRLGTLVPQLSPNPLAYAASASLLAFVLGVGRREPAGVRVTSLAGGVVALLVMVATGSRVASVLGGLTLVVALVYALRRRVEVLSLGLLAVLAGVLYRYDAVSAAVSGFLQRGEDANGRQTLTGRTVIWKLALQQWREHPVLGLGYFSGHRLGIPGLDQDQSNIDNTWIESLVDVGLLGTVVLACATLAGFVAVLTIRSMRATTRLWTVSVVLIGVGLSFLNPTVQSPGVGMILLAVPIIGAGYLREDRGSSARGVSPPVQAGAPELRHRRAG